MFVRQDIVFGDKLTPQVNSMIGLIVTVSSVHDIKPTALRCKIRITWTPMLCRESYTAVRPVHDEQSPQLHDVMTRQGVMKPCSTS